MNVFRKIQAKWNQVNSPENVAAFNEKMKQSMIGGGIVGGGVRGVENPMAKDFIQHVYSAQQNPNLTARIKSVAKVKEYATQQLTPDELSRAKDVLIDPVVKKIHERILNQEAGFYIPNVFRKR